MAENPNELQDKTLEFGFLTLPKLPFPSTLRKVKSCSVYFLVGLLTLLVRGGGLGATACHISSYSSAIFSYCFSKLVSSKLATDGAEASWVGDVGGN